MSIRPLVLCLTLLSTTATAFAASSPSFDRLNAKGKKTGDASFSIQIKNDIIKVQCEINSDTKSGTDTWNTEYQIGKDGLLDSGSIGKFSDKSLTLFLPSKTNDALTIRTTKSHVETASRTLTIPKPDIFLAFPDDPSVYQVLLKVIADHPHADNVYYLLIPASGKTPDRIETFRLNPPDASTGKLNGKSIALKHFALTFKDGSGDLYTDADGNLMEAVLPIFDVTHVRRKFTLNPTSPAESQ